MNTRMIVPSSPRARTRGASVVTVIVALAIVAALAAAAWFLIFRPHRQAVIARAPVVQPKHVAAKQAPPPADVAAMSNSELLTEASKAIKEQRLLAPAGNNAFEFYLKVLERQPDNQVAQDALRETFPFGANAAEQSINQRDFAEAQREIALLSKADPDNYTLTILRSKLDAQRKLRVQEQQQAAQELLAQQQQAAKARQEAEARALAEQKAEAARQQAAQQAQAQPQVAQQQAPAPETPPPARTKVTIQDAVLVRKVNPRYPTVAARTRREGWVDVEFTVGTDGEVDNVHVIDADPRHVFDRAATSAVGRWEYKPALRNGKPMAVTMRRRIVFTLNGG